MIINDPAAVAWLEQQASATLAVREEINALTIRLRFMAIRPAAERARLTARLDQMVDWWREHGRGVSCTRNMVELIHDHPDDVCIRCNTTQERIA